MTSSDHQTGCDERVDGRAEVHSTETDGGSDESDGALGHPQAPVTPANGASLAASQGQAGGPESRTDQSQLHLGVARCGNVCFAIPVEYLAEVARVTKLSAMPQSAPGLQGALDLRGSLVPIFDPGVFNGYPSDHKTAPRFAAILRRGNALLGLGIDQIEGLIRVPAEKVQCISNAGSVHKSGTGSEQRQPTAEAPLFSGTLLHEDTVLSVISPDSLFSRSDVLCVTKKSPVRDPVDGISTSSSMAKELDEPMLIFSAGGADYALQAVAIQGTVPRTSIDENALTAGACIGSIHYHGQRVPVLRTQMITGLGTVSESRSSEIVMLRFEDGARVGMAVDAIECMRNMKPSSVQPVPPAVARAEAIVAGVETSTERQTFVLCPEKIRRNALIRNMATLSMSHRTPSTKTEKTLKVGADIVQERIRHLIFDVGTSLATPADQILRILKPPTLLTPCRASNIPGIEGIFRLEDRPVLLVDLATRLGLTQLVAKRNRILLVAFKAYWIGFAVNDIEGIDTSQWRRTEKKGTDTGTIVQLGFGEHRRILPALDLESLAASLCA